jgi:hypothetical protein
VTHAYVLDWRKWRSYKAENAAEFRIIDAQILEEHTKMAESWE